MSLRKHGARNVKCKSMIVGAPQGPAANVMNELKFFKYAIMRGHIICT